MPKSSLVLLPGRPLPDHVRELLVRYFGNDQISRLERFGGRVQVSMTSPYTPRGTGKRTRPQIDLRYVENLWGKRTDIEAVKTAMNELTIADLRKLGALIGSPVRTSSSRPEALDELLSYFRSEETWKSIAGSGSAL